MHLLFDLMMGEPVFGHPHAGMMALIVAMVSLAVVVAMCLKLHFDKMAHTVVFFTIVCVVCFVSGRIYLYHFKPPDVNILPSTFGKSILFKIIVPLFIYNACFCMANIKFLNQSPLLLILFLGMFVYLTTFLLQFAIIYSFVHLCFLWQARTVMVLCACITLYQTGIAIELLESKGGHVKYLQATLKAEAIWDILMSYTVVEHLLKIGPLSLGYTNQDVGWAAYQWFMAFCGVPYGVVMALAVLPLYYFAFGNAKISPLISVFSCIFVYSSAQLLQLNGSAATAGFSCVLTVLIRPKMMAAHEIFLRQLYQIIYIIITTVICAMAGFVIGCIGRPLDLRFFCFAFGIFALSLMLRLIAIFVSFPLLHQRSTKWSELSVVVIGPNRGLGSALLAMWYAINDVDENLQVLVIIVILILMSLFTNILLINWIVERLNVFHLSRAQISNMNVAIDQINKCRGNMIFAEKVDRLIADANWAVVSRITKFKHPYEHRVRTTEFAESFKDEIKTVQCPRCGKWTVAPPTRKEIDEVTRETKLRVMKAQQVSFIKQRDAGTLTIDGYKFLANLVYQASYTEEITVNTDDLRLTEEDLKCYKQMQSFFKRIAELTEEAYDWQPTNKFRSKCYHITVSQSFRITMAIISLLDMFLCLSFVIVYSQDKMRKRPNTDTTVYLGKALSFLFIMFYLLNLCEAFIQFLGVGFWQYFSKTVYKIEFLSCVIMRSLQVLIYFYECSQVGKYMNLADTSPQIVYLNFLLCLRITRFYIFFVALIPSILKRIDTCIDKGYLKKYDIGKAYLVGLDRVLRYLGQLTTNERVREEIKKEIEANRQKVTKELGHIQKEHPNIAITVKTKHAIRHVMNAMQECSEGMQNEGILDMIEANALMKSIKKLRSRVNKLGFIVPPLPINILKEIPWLQGDEENTELFLSQAMMYNYDYNDYLIRNGDDPVGLYILVSGLLKASYVPSPTTIGLAQKFGVLPCYDFFENFKFDQPQEEFIVSGNVIGEMGLVTGRRYDMSVVADTAVQTYFIPDRVMKSLHETTSGQNLLAKIWKRVAARISMTLLQFTNTYRSWSQEKLMMYLQKGFLPDLTGIVAVNLDAKVEEAILIQGVAMDATNQNIIYGPYRVPKTVTKLLMPDHRWWRFQTVYETKIYLVLASGSSVADMLETYSEPEIILEPTIEEEQKLEKKKRVLDKTRKVGFATEDDD